MGYVVIQQQVPEKNGASVNPEFSDMWSPKS